MKKLKYDQALSKVLSGNLSSAAAESFQFRDALTETPDQFLERQLISFRLALKSGNSSLPVEALQESLTENMFLKAEIFFFKGAYYGQYHDHEKAEINFMQAARCYEQLNMADKRMLSKFNSHIAKSHQQKVPWQQEELELRQLILESHTSGQAKTEFLALRQLSYKYFEQGHFNQAIDLIITWVGRKDVITKSDSELALVHIADCYFEMRDLKNAFHYIEQVSADCDERVLFPRGYVRAKIFQLPFDPSQFTYISDYWKSRADGWSLQTKQKTRKSVALTWNTTTNLITKGKSIVAKIKPQSLEGQVIKHLSASPKTKSHICESLWPGEMTTDFLDDRFHQLVQRLNRKIKNLVIFDGQSYRLGTEVHVQS